MDVPCVTFEDIGLSLKEPDALEEFVVVEELNVNKRGGRPKAKNSSARTSPNDDNLSNNLEENVQVNQQENESSTSAIESPPSKRICLPTSTFPQEIISEETAEENLSPNQTHPTPGDYDSVNNMASIQRSDNFNSRKRGRPKRREVFYSRPRGRPRGQGNSSRRGFGGSSRRQSNWNKNEEDGNEEEAEDNDKGNISIGELFENYIQRTSQMDSLAANENEYLLESREANDISRTDDIDYQHEVIHRKGRPRKRGSTLRRSRGRPAAASYAIKVENSFFTSTEEVRYSTYPQRLRREVVKFDPKKQSRTQNSFHDREVQTVESGPLEGEEEDDDDDQQQPEQNQVVNSFSCVKESSNDLNNEFIFTFTVTISTNDSNKTTNVQVHPKTTTNLPVLQADNQSVVDGRNRSEVAPVRCPSSSAPGQIPENVKKGKTPATVNYKVEDTNVSQTHNGDEYNSSVQELLQNFDAFTEFTEESMEKF